METGSPLWLNWIIVIVFFGGFFAVGFLLYERQRNLLERVAKRYGFTYSEGGTHLIHFPSERAIKRNRLINKCRPEVRWYLRGEMQGVEVCIYKMRLRTGSSSDSRSRTWGYPYLIGRFVQDGLDLPDVLIQPRSILGRIRKRVFRYIDTPLERHPLDPDYQVSSDSDDEVIQTFDQAACQHFISGKFLTFEGLANAFSLFEKPSHLKFLLMTDASLERFLKKGVNLAIALKNSSIPDS